MSDVAQINQESLRQKSVLISIDRKEKKSFSVLTTIKEVLVYLLSKVSSLQCCQLYLF